MPTLPADDLEKSLAKILISFVSLLVAFSSVHRVLKRGALRIKDMALFYVSLALQVSKSLCSLRVNP